MKSVFSYITKGSKLIIVYLLTVIVAGSILTYLSINNISNFEELTEKRITEEEKEIVENYRTQIERSLENLVVELKDLIKTDTLNHQLNAFILENVLVDNYLIMDKNGVFTRPHFLDNSFNLLSESVSYPFNQKYRQVEQYEFVEMNYGLAEKQYLNALKLAMSKSDTAKIYNAVARLNIKEGRQKKAIEFYKKIISEYQFSVNDFGYPYAYFSVSQLLKLTEISLKKEVEKTILYFLKGLNDYTIPYNSSTVDLINSVLKWTDQINTQKSKEQIKHLSHKISIKISEISSFRKGMTAVDKNEKINISNGINDFHLVENITNPNQLMLLKKSSNNLVGFIVHLKALDSIVKNKINPFPNKFEYDIQLVDTEPNNSLYNQKLTTQGTLSPYFTKKMVSLKLKSPENVEDFIFKRKLMTGIGLSLLLAAMLIGLFTLHRDVSNKIKMDQMRSDFVSNVTHELKTPLTSINMFADSIVLNRVTEEKEIKKYAQVILKESERLKRMVNNILDFSRKENDKLNYQLQESNIANVVRDIMLEMNYWLDINKFEIQLDLEENVFAKIDPEGLKQVLSNLITNAIKYSDINKKIEIRVFRKSDEVFIEVEDQGIGIPKDKLSTIFEKFYRVNSSKNENISGTGLGLNVSKAIIEAQNGKLLVRSTLGRGSIFTIVLTN